MIRRERYPRITPLRAVRLYSLLANKTPQTLSIHELCEVRDALLNHVQANLAKRRR